jgi:two-component system, NtrC family, response regulator AtoC
VANILLIEDDENLRLTIGRALRKVGHQVVDADSVIAARAAFAESHFDLILSDVNLGSESGIDYIQDVRESGYIGGIIMMTAYATVDDAVRAMKLGADDYLAKPVRMQELLLLTDRVIAQRDTTRRLRLYQRLEESNRERTDQPLGESEAWVDAMSLAQRLASIPVGNRSQDNGGSAGGALTTILITGETGTGKGVVARYIHDSSAECGLPFVHVNCTALPASLIESELFGHEKGAFTDAKTAREGLFEMADGGTIFLDEIGDLDLPLQAKLLSVIEHGMIRKVGSAKERSIRMRVLAATNKNLRSMVQEGTFREDLLFRINAFSIELPKLVSRGEDAILIGESMLDQLRNEYGLEPAVLSEDAKVAIRQHSWPGNVRELFNAIQRAAMLAPSVEITRQDLALVSGGSVESGIEQGCTDQDHEMRFNFESGIHTAGDVERELMIQALEHSKGNVSMAAKLIGMQRSSFRYRVERYGIVTSDPRVSGS